MTEFKKDFIPGKLYIVLETFVPTEIIPKVLTSWEDGNLLIPGKFQDEYLIYYNKFPKKISSGSVVMALGSFVVDLGSKNGISNLIEIPVFLHNGKTYTYIDYVFSGYINKFFNLVT